jgi:GT2 family glycosyltransferase
MSVHSIPSKSSNRDPEPSLAAEDPFGSAPKPSVRKDGSTPSSLPAPFHLGDFTTAALRGDSSEWEKYAALGLVGKTKEALEGLKRFDHPEALFYTGVAHWIEGNEPAAIRILEKISAPHAQNLLALIRRPQIQVLAQLPWSRRAPHDLLTGALKDPKFKIKNIGFHPQDLPNEPYADIHKFYHPSHAPDFYVCAMVEWHLIPPNLQELPCPIIGVTADYDVHIQALYPWLSLFDEVVVDARKEWREVRQLVSAPVSTFPKLFGVAESLPPIPKGPRVTDVFLSGTMVHPYHPDKARLLHQIFQVPGIRIRCIDGFVNPEVYNLLLGHSKVCFTYVRHPDGMVTRGLEALSMGCALVVQKGSVLTLYGGEEEGVLTYEFEALNLVPAIRHILDRWPEFEVRARRGAEVIRREFALSRVASHFFRFLTFLAAKPRMPRRIQAHGRLSQKRSIFAKGWLPRSPSVLKKILTENVARWKAELKEESRPHLFIDMAREFALAKTPFQAGENSPSASAGPVTNLIEFYLKGITQFPKSLVLRLNFIRVVFHLGKKKDWPLACQVAEETLGLPPSNWQIDFLEDVFPWDYFSNFFNYRKYLDLLNEYLRLKKPVQDDLIRLIQASIHYYLGKYLKNLDHLKGAVTLDPDFPHYRWEYAQQLVKRGKENDFEEAGLQLVQLAKDSILFLEAAELLNTLQGEGKFVCSEFEEIKCKAQRAYQSIRFLHPSQLTRFLPSRTALLPEGKSRSARKDFSPDSPLEEAGLKSYPGGKEILVSALVPTYESERFMQGLLESLEAQTIADRMEIVIVDTGSPTNEKAIVKDFQKRYDNIVYLRIPGRENSHTALNRCIRLARGKYLSLACTDDRHKEDALERMVSVLDSRPDIALVYANNHITVFENETFDNFSPVGTYRWADFDPQLLLQGCFAGPQPMWRRSLHEKYGYFDEGLQSAGDWEFWLRLAERETFLHIDEFLGLYLFSPTSSEHRNPELSRKEGEIVRQRYIHREPILAEKKKRGERHQLAESGTLVLALRGTGTDEELSSLVEQMRNPPSVQGEPSVKVVRIHGGIPENSLGVTVSPPTPTALQALHQGVDWEARYVVLLSADVTLPSSLLDSLIAIAESDPSIGAVGPVSNEAPDPQQVGQFLAGEEGVEDLAERLASRFGKDWKEVPYLGSFCLLLKSDAVRKAGGVRQKLSAPMAMWQLFGRLRSRGFKVVCAPGIYVPHRELTPEEGKKFIELQAAEDGLREGERKFGEGLLKEAEEAFRGILRDFPDHPEANNDLACLLWQTGRREEALKGLLKVMTMVPDHRDVIWNLGQFFKEMGRDQEAFQVYRTYSALHQEEQEMVEIMNQWAPAARVVPRVPEFSQELPGRYGPA